MLSPAEDRFLRQQVMRALTVRTVHNGGWVTREELSAFPLGAASVG